jgi:hypothetical protein
MGFSSGKTAPTNIDLDSAQTLQNKTIDSTNSIDGVTISTSEIDNPSKLDVKRDSFANLETYAASADNGQIVYATDNKEMYQVVDGQLIVLGSNADGVNYIENSDFELDTSGYTGDTNLTITKTEVSTEVLRGSASAKITKAVTDATDEEVTVPFTVDRADLAKKLTIQFEYDTSDAGYQDDYIRLYVRKDPNGTPEDIRVNNEDLKGGKGTHIAQFQTDAIIDEYELVFRVNNADVTGYDIFIDDVKVGPREVAYGSLVTDWVSYTPTFTGLGTVTNIDIKYRRVGQNLEILGDFTTGTTSATETEMTLPQSLVVGTENNSILKVGTFRRDSSVTSSNSFTILATDGDSFLNFSVNNQTSNFNPLEPRLSTQMVASSERISIEATIPIQGWSSNAVSSEDLGGREVRLRAVSNNGQTVNNTTSIFVYEEVQVDSTNSYDSSTGIFTAPESGTYLINGSFNIAGTTDICFASLRKNGVEIARNIQRSDPNSNPVVTSILDLVKGDEIAIFARSTTSNSAQTEVYCFLDIQKLTSPQTILETETVAARYTSDSGQSGIGSGTTIVYEDKDYDTHNAYDSSTGEYTVPVTGLYTINARIRVNELFPKGTVIAVNGTTITAQNVDNGDDDSVTVSDILLLNKNDVIDIRYNRGNTVSLQAISEFNTFSIARIK